jgi:L-ascorbate metabolism protein UlaG (beta-lactamase superfamily)
MRITHLGHACVLVESDGGACLLVDPGTYSTGFEELTGLTAVAVTHQHPDHVDASRLGALAEANPQAPLLLETETAAALEDDRVGAVTPVTAGQKLTVGDLTVRAIGGRHAVNHERVPTTGNVGYLVHGDGRTFFHPGDSYDETPTDVDVLGLPLNAPWCRMAETLAFLDAIAPAAVVPIHTGLLNEHGLAGYLMHVDRFGPDGCDLVDLRPGSSYDV